MDGTFLTVPPQLAQLYAVRGLSHGRLIVGTYRLLPNKRLGTYNKFLTQISNLTNQLTHKTLQSISSSP